MFVVTSVLMITSAFGFVTCKDETYTDPTPIVLWHGLMDASESNTNMKSIIGLISKHIPGAYVKSLQIGSSSKWDRVNSVIMDVNKQVKLACDMIKNDKELQRGYHAFGISQGGQFLRAVAQRCPVPPMFNLVSLGGQHQGVYGLVNVWYFRPVFALGNFFSYSYFIRNHIVPAQNWHDPIHHDLYVRRNTFIADINRENNKNPHYRDNLLKLKHLVLFKWENDEAVVPRESSWFGFYKKGQAVEIENVFDSELYKEDKIGLKELFESTRLHLLGAPGTHLQYGSIWLVENIVLPWLAQTYWEKNDKNSD